MTAVAKLISLGAEVRNLPGTEYIRTEPSEASTGGVHIVVKFNYFEHPIDFEVDEFSEWLLAAREILKVAIDMDERTPQP